MARKRINIGRDMTVVKEEPTVEEIPGVEVTALDTGPSKPTPVSKPVAQKKPSVLMLTFDRWFTTTGRPAHHKAGMRAYVKVKGKRTKAFWDGLFESY